MWYMNISIFAAIGAQNLWDELILKNEIELLEQEFWEDTIFQVASYDPKNPIFRIENTQYFEYFPIWIKNPKNILRNLKNFLKFLSVIFWSNVVVIWGGGIIYDSEIQSVKNPLDQWIFRVKVARFFRKKIYFYAIWIDIKNSENFQKLQKIFKNAWKITVRDEKSKAQLLQVWIQSELVDDPVMQETNRKWDILQILSSKNFSLHDFETIDFSEKYVGIALRSGYIWKTKNSKLEALLVEEFCNFIEKKWGKIVFLPHSLHKSDFKANDYEFMKQFVKGERKIFSTLQEVYSWYQSSDMENKIMISMRLHSIILSYVYGIQQIVLSYSQKTDEATKKLTK